ncbi:hypothetical protein J4475_02775 [Candidatus Woesearchaeota archaeon]|nr:hypothetical protein [Candidatus Woesearchaeota archaeon]
MVYAASQTSLYSRALKYGVYIFSALAVVGLAWLFLGKFLTSSLFAFLLSLLGLMLLSVVIETWSKGVMEILGIDLLFIGTFILAYEFNLWAGLAGALFLTVLHALLQAQKARFIVYALIPLFMVALLTVWFNGFGMLWLAAILLALYHVIGTFIITYAGGLGIRYATFVVINVLFNAILIKLLGFVL